MWHFFISWCIVFWEMYIKFKKHFWKSYIHLKTAKYQFLIFSESYLVLQIYCFFFKFNELMWEQKTNCTHGHFDSFSVHFQNRKSWPSSVEVYIICMCSYFTSAGRILDSLRIVLLYPYKINMCHLILQVMIVFHHFHFSRLFQGHPKLQKNNLFRCPLVTYHSHL